MIRAAIFDMDGLLIDSEPLWRKAFDEVLEPLGIKSTNDDWVNHQGQGIVQSVDYYAHKYGLGDMTSDEAIKEISRRVIDLIENEGKALPGVKSTLETCKQNGLKMAVASSSAHKIIDAVMSRLDIREYFDEVHSGQEEDHAKPHPAVFISTARKLGVEPRQCVVFEDAPSGVLAAKAAKMKCIAAVESHVKDHSYIGTADIVLDSLEEFDFQMIKTL